MENLELKSLIKVCQIEELSQEEHHLIELAIAATDRSYSPYSHFKVGAAVLLENGVEQSVQRCFMQVHSIRMFP